MSIDDDDEATRILPSSVPRPSPPAERTEIAPQRTEIAPPPAAFDPDGDATVIRPRPPPPAAQRPGSNEGGNMLPVGFYLGEFEIIELLGEGGFGIVYLAYDHSLGRRSRSRNSCRSGMASRTQTMRVTVRSQHRGNLQGGSQELRQ